MWWNDYVGIPYELKGRDKSGLDCWGLLRLVYKEQFNIDLPSFSEKYDVYDQDLFQELLATQREGWFNVQDPIIGDAVLLRVLGLESHVGIYIGDRKFLHAKDGTNSVIESLDSARWKTRFIGFYRYLPNKATLTAIANPLSTQRIDTVIDCSKPLIEVQNHIKTIKDHEDGVFMVDGRIIPKDQWDTFVPGNGQRVEYRALLSGGDVGRTFLTLAVVYVAFTYGPALASYFTGTTVAAGSAAAAVGSAAITITGTLLINKIFPIRPPELPQGIGIEQAKSQLMLQGGQNQATPYSAIPIVLGKFRYSPPLGAITYVEANATTNYLRLLLVWGYGELSVSDIRIGDVDINSYEDIEYETINDYEIDSGDEIKRFNQIYGKDVSQDIINLELNSDGTDVGSPYTEKVISDQCDQIEISIYFPEGLRKMLIEGESAGKVQSTPFTGQIQFRQLDPNTLAPLTSWGNIDNVSIETVLNFEPAWFNIDNDEELEKVYRWTRITLDEDGKIKRYDGAYTSNQYENPSGNLLIRLQNSTYGFSTTYNRLPLIDEGEEELWQVCVYGNEIITTTDMRDASITGAGITVSGLKATIASATITRASTENIQLGDSGQPYENRKDAFTYKKVFNVAKGKYEVRVRRTNDSESDYVSGSYKGIKYHKAIFLAVTGYENTKPVIAPRGVQLCMTAIRIKATDQINGNIDSISGTVQTAAYDFANKTITSSTRSSNVVTATLTNHGFKVSDKIQIIGSANSGFDGYFTITSATTNTFTYAQTAADASTTGGRIWLKRLTRNPASLMRYVLQHPGNAQKIADSKINFEELETWHSFCRTNKFMFDMVMLSQRSVFDVLKDICAAGRSSPTLRDGKWTVITEKQRSAIAQYFTPHNSWGFQSQKVIPTLPHAYRVAFNNAEKSYQPDEMIVYNDGYSYSNATLFEQMSFPGITTKDQIFKNTRFHLAQLKLRPETYVLNVDFENLICTRGDLVRVTHDIPMWGLGTGRIKSRITSTQIELDNPVPMDAGVQYTIRIRLEDGTSITRTVASKLTDGEYTTIDLTSSVTTTQAATGNLFMFGSLSDESNMLVVESIEPMDNMTARLTLVDYSSSIYDSDDEVIPAFDSNITRPPYLQQLKITQSPTIDTITSDESVMIRLSPNSYEYRIKVNFTNPINLQNGITKVIAQIDFANDKIIDYEQNIIIEAKARSVIFGNVQEGSSYVIRLCYTDDFGRLGPWVYSSSHTVVGKANPPATVGNVTAVVEGNQIRLDWPDNTEPDIEFYEVRTSDSNWGDSYRLFKGKVSTCLVDAPLAGNSTTWYVKAIDGANNYSTLANSISYTTAEIDNTTTVSNIFADTSLTNATITLDWSDVTTVFGLDFYEVSYSSIIKKIKSNTITLAADWIGIRDFTIKTVDLNGNKSSGYTYSVTKLAPNSPINFRAQVIDNTVMFYWSLPSKTTLPIDHVLLKRGSTWATATSLGEKKGSFTTINENTGGIYTYWLAVVDTDNNESDPVSISTNVADPPDFVFHGDFTSDFSGTKSSAITESGAILLPVNTTETWASHFTSRSWSTPQNQIDAGYPIFIQPANGSGYYEETFDFGTTLASSQITLTYSGTIVSGSPSVKTDISISSDNVTYTLYEATENIYGTNFRYVKIKITVTESTGTGLYLINSIYVRLDAKLKNDAGSVSALSTDADGTIVNFNKEFIDVQSITLTAAGTTSTTAVYDFQNANLSATYSVTSNVCTVTYTAHGLIAGQNVRLQFSSGNGVPGVYTITGYTANTFTFAMTVGNTSGNCIVYAESFRVYLFNSSGSRVSATASWSSKGY